MKGNDGRGDCVERDEWETPTEIYEAFNQQYDFDFDCCATIKNSKWFSFSNDFESITQLTMLQKCAWMNPPFSKAKQMFEHFFRVVDKGVAIYRCDNMETSVWQDIILPNASWVWIPSGRVKYTGMKGKGSRFPSALIGFNVLEPQTKRKGVCLKINKR